MTADITGHSKFLQRHTDHFNSSQCRRLYRFEKWISGMSPKLGREPLQGIAFAILGYRESMNKSIHRQSIRDFTDRFGDTSWLSHIYSIEMSTLLVVILFYSVLKNNYRTKTPTYCRNFEFTTSRKLSNIHSSHKTIYLAIWYNCWHVVAMKIHDVRTPVSVRDIILNWDQYIGVTWVVWRQCVTRSVSDDRHSTPALRPGRRLGRPFNGQREADYHLN